MNIPTKLSEAERQMRNRLNFCLWFGIAVVVILGYLIVPIVSVLSHYLPESLATLMTWIYSPTFIVFSIALSTLISLVFLWLIIDLLRALTQSIRSRAAYFDAQRERLEKDTAKD